MKSPLEDARKFTSDQLEDLLGGRENVRRLIRGEMKCVLEVVKMILPINRDKLFDLELLFGPHFTIWRGPVDGKGLEGPERQDIRSLALREVDFTEEVLFYTGLADCETTITGEERLSRLQKNSCILPDAQIGYELYKEKGQRTLHWLHETQGVNWMEFTGTELRHPNGDRCFFFLYLGVNGEWIKNFRPLDGIRRAKDLALVLAKSELEA